MNDQIYNILDRIAVSQNGDRPAVLRELGAALASLDAAAWLDLKPQLEERLPLKSKELEALRADGRKQAETSERVEKKLKEEESRAAAALAAAARGETSAGPAYEMQTGAAGTPMLYWRKPTPDGVIPTRVADCVPRVTAEKVRHAAAGGMDRWLTIELATARGLRLFDVLPDDLADPRRFYAACIRAAGSEARLSNTSGTKHLTLAAFALADPDRAHSEVYEFTGWHEHDGALVYLSAAGAIGAPDDLTVDLGNLAAGAGVPGLQNFGPRDDGQDTLQTGLQALAGPVRGAFPDQVTLPGLAAVFLAPLLRWSPTLDRPTLHYIGTSGVRKSAWLGLLQAFFGLPEPALSWRGTANSIEIALSALRDAVVTVDDLKTSTSDHGAGTKIIQAYADRRGRSRATRGGELARARFVGGMLVSAGEDIHAGEASVAARALFVPIGAHDARLDTLSAAQHAATSLPTVTARYIAWLLQHQDTIGQRITEKFLSARKHYRELLSTHSGINDAGRVAVNCALLDMAAATAGDWLLDEGWDRERALEWWQATRKTLEHLAQLQAASIGQESAARAFLSALRALLDGRRLELAHPPEDAPIPALAGYSPTYPTATVAGWAIGKEIWLQPDLAMHEVRRWLSAQGRALPTERGIYAQLRDGGWLAETGQRTTVPKWIGGATRRVLVLKADALDDQADDFTEENFSTEGALHV